MPLIIDEFIDDQLPITDLPILFWQNVASASNITTDSEDSDFPATNLANPSLQQKWKQDFTNSPVAMPDYITVNIAGLGPINYVALAGHNLGSISATVAVEGTGSASPEHQDSPPETEYVTGYSPSDDSPIIFMFAEVETDMIRLRIQSPGVTAAEIAVLYVGKATVMSQGIQSEHTPLPESVVHRVVTGESENGSFLGRIMVSRWLESTATIANIDADWARDEIIPFLEFAAEYPFFWAWSPLSHPDGTAFAWLTNDPAPSFDYDGYASIQLSMRGIAE